jgi:TonB family protein
MKHKILLAFAVLCSTVLMTVAQENKTEKVVKNFEELDEEPSFPGGTDSLYAFLARNIKYPTDAKEKGIEGRVYVSFIVETDGTFSNVKILRDIGGGCGEEVLRVLMKMPKWTPGRVGEKKVRVMFNLPVTFSLWQHDTPKRKK